MNPKEDSAGSPLVSSSSMLCLIYQHVVDSDSSFPMSLGHSSILNEWNMSSLLLIQLRAAEQGILQLGAVQNSLQRVTFK